MKLKWWYFVIVGIALVGVLDLEAFFFRVSPRAFTFFFLTGNLFIAGMKFKENLIEKEEEK